MTKPNSAAPTTAPSRNGDQSVTIGINTEPVSLAQAVAELGKDPFRESSTVGTGVAPLAGAVHG